MRKRTCMGIMLAAVIMAACGFYMARRDNVWLRVDGETPWLSVRADGSENRVLLWENADEGEAVSGYFFLPSCVKSHRIRLGDTGESSVRIDGDLLEPGDVFTWEEDRSYQLQVTDSSYEPYTCELVFMESENIPAVFIDTASGGLDYLHDDKNNEETGKICVVREDGNTEYQNELTRISGRGNNTWGYEKKPYAIKLKDAVPLLGLERSDRWQLLALWRESSKMDNKIAMDLATALEIPYTAQGTWIDLYMNGEYRGIYLLMESVTVGEGRVDIYNLEKDNKSLNPSIEQETAEHYEEEDNKGYLIESGADPSGGYLVEKVHPDHWQTDESGFLTSGNDHFAVNAPKHASKEQVSYIQNCVEDIDLLVQSGDPAVWEKLDLATFTKLFLVDEITMEMDAGCASMFFYKDRGDDMLYAGPPWDYDNAFGEYDSGDGFYLDYHGSIADNSDRQAIALDWYQKLCGTPAMQEQITKEYAQVLPFFEQLLGSGIDEYANRIRASVGMDHARWENTVEPDGSVPRYENYDANVSYMKFFLANRLNCLCERWGAPHEPFAAPANGEMHRVTFSVYEGVVETIEVPDGEELAYTPEYDASKYQGWTYRRRGGTYSPYIPVYEDMELYNAKWE